MGAKRKSVIDYKNYGKCKVFGVPQSVVDQTLKIYTPENRTITRAEVLAEPTRGLLAMRSWHKIQGHFYVDARVDHFTEIEATICYNQSAYAFLFFVVSSGLAKEFLLDSKFPRQDLCGYRDDSARRRALMYLDCISSGCISHLGSLDVMRILSRFAQVDPSKLRDIQFMLSFIIAKNNIRFWKPMTIENELECWIVMKRYICKRPDLIFLDTRYDFEDGKAHGDVMLAIKFNE